MSTQTHTKREKGQALFLTALMVLSVFAMSAAFAGAAAADQHDEVDSEWELGTQSVDEDESVPAASLGDYHFWSGQEIDVDGFDNGANVLFYSADEDEPLEELTADENGQITIDTEGLEGEYYLTGPGAEGDSQTFLVLEQSLDAEFDPDSVVEDDGETELVLDTIRANYDIEVSSEDIEDDELDSIFDDINDENVIEDVDDSIEADFSEVETGEHELTFEVTDTGAEADASIEVTEEPADDASLDANQYSEEAGDIVEFTVDMENADNAVLTLADENGDYWADVHIAGADDDEVDVSFNTYNAGQDDGDVVSTDSDADVNLIDDRSIENDSHLLPGDYDLRLYLTDEGDSDEVDTVEDGDRADVEDLQWVDAAELELTEGSIGDATPGVAPGDADLDADTDAEDVNDATTQGEEVAEGDYFVVGVDASGVFGFLVDGDFGDEITFEMEQTNPNTYESAEELDHNDVDVVQDPENDRLFFILDTEDENVGVEEGAEYDVTFSVSEDYVYADEDTESTTSFSVVDRSVEVTGDFGDDDRLQVEQSEESLITGESSIAPDSDVQVRLGLGALNPGTMSQTVQVQDDGTIEADFDLSDREVGEELDVTFEDHNSDASDSVTAVLVESADDHDQDPHTVTITVTDADGEPVEDAEVDIDGQIETTDSNGEATFELAHGEYDVSATHDGESASGTVSVDDESSDTGSLTLGEEDAGEINDPADDADDKDADDDTGVDDDDAADADDDAADADDGTDTDDDDDPEDEEQPGFGIAVALIALLAAAGIALRNRA